MDKLEISEQMAKAIVQHLMERNVIRIYAKLKRYITMNPYITQEMLEKYIREATLKYLEKEVSTLTKERIPIAYQKLKVIEIEKGVYTVEITDTRKKEADGVHNEEG